MSFFIHHCGKIEHCILKYTSTYSTCACVSAFGMSFMCALCTMLVCRYKQVHNHSFVILCALYTVLVCCSERGRATVRVLAAGGHTRQQQRHTDINAKRHHAPSRRHASVISFNGAQRTSFVSHSQRRNVRGFCWWYVATIGLLTIGKSHYSNAPAAKCFAL